MAGGMFTAVGVLSALVERAQSGLGQHVDVAMFDCQVALLENAIVRYTSTGEVPGPVGYRHPLTTPHGAVPASDGWLVLANVKEHDWDEFLVRVGLEDLAGDERFRTNASRTEHYAVFEPLLFEAFRKRTVQEWLDELSDISLIGPMNNVSQVVEDPQVQARNMVVELPTWTGGSLKVSNSPVKLSRTPAGAQRGASKPGEHTADILARSGLDEAAIDDLVARGVARTGPEQP
jgi:CoA:oxalate CoA-transferase